MMFSTSSSRRSRLVGANVVPLCKNIGGHFIYVSSKFTQLSSGFLDRCLAVGSLDPARVVCARFLISPTLLVEIETLIASKTLRNHLPNEFDAAGLSHTPLFVALLAKMMPSPATAIPDFLIEVAHLDVALQSMSGHATCRSMR